MARPREFDRDNVLDSVMLEFWQHGFAATSYADLVQATGLGRQSLYQAFGDKQALFVAAVEHYSANITGQSLEILNGDGSPRGNIERWIHRLCEQVCRHRRGCMMTNTSTESNQHDDGVIELVRKGLYRVEATLRKALQRAVAAEEIAADSDATSLATFLLGTAQGLMVLGRLGVSREKLKSYITTALSIL